MNNETDWVGRTDESDVSAERYHYFMTKEPREELGPIRVISDPYLGVTKVRDVRIGMVRNAKDEDKKAVLAYLQPYPHMRIEKGKELQGWYQSLHNESAASRPRPCFTEAVLTEPYGGWCAVGCKFSLPAGELVDTPNGSAPIESFKVGDSVLGRTPLGVQITKVVGVTSHWKPEGLVRLILNDGRKLLMTGDHPVYSVSRRAWVNAVNLKPGERLESLPMRYGHTEPQESLRCLPVSDSLRERHEEVGQVVAYQGEAQVYGDAPENERPCSREQRVYEQEGQWAEIPGMEISPSGTSQERRIGIQTFQARPIHGQKRSHISNEVGMGTVTRGVPRPPWVRLGLRTVFNFVAGRVGICARLRSPSRQLYIRGERVHDCRRREENSASQTNGIPRGNFRPKGTKEIGDTYVVGVEKIPGRVRVHDIQTESQNFFQRGVLVHNCYINSGMRGYRGTGLITVPLGYGDQVRQQITKMRRGAAGYFSSFTDPFTPLEQYYHNTEEGAKAFVDAGLPLFFLSRLRYPDWAVDLLKLSPYSYAQKSLNTGDAADWKLLSPGAMSLEDHYADIERLKTAGIYVSIQVNPIVPGVTSHGDIVKLFQRLRAVGADHVIVKFVEAGYSWAPAMVERMKQTFGERGAAFEKLFTQNIGSQRTVEEEYRLKAHRMYSSYARKYGLTYSVCYEYKYARDADGKVLSKTGVSIARDFTTSDQCHGHAVPVFTRASDAEQFRPVEECPPSGCLHCSEDNAGKPRCGDELAGEANAVEMRDLKIPIGEGKGRATQLIQLGVKK